MDSLFHGVFEYLMHRGMHAIARVLEGDNFAAIAVVIWGLATLCIALIPIRGLDILGIAMLAILSIIMAWAVYSSIRRVLKEIRMRNRSLSG